MLKQQGDTCESDIEDCASQPCVNNGVCKDAVDHFTCDCENTGFEGETCAVDINECSDAANCVHGICENRPGSFECRCQDGYLGARCQAADPCFPDVANNNATRHMCHRGQCVRARVQSSSDGKQVETVVYECECDPGFQGAFCTEPIGVVRRSRAPPLTYIVGPILLIIILLSVAGCLSLLLVVRNKRASHGTYSPSRQEVTGALAMQMNPMIRPPPEERLI